MLSSQTKDEVTDAAVKSLRAALGGSLSLTALLNADASTISAAIQKVGFWRRKTEYVDIIACTVSLGPCYVAVTSCGQL